MYELKSLFNNEIAVAVMTTEAKIIEILNKVGNISTYFNTVITKLKDLS